MSTVLAPIENDDDDETRSNISSRSAIKMDCEEEEELFVVEQDKVVARGPR